MHFGDIPTVETQRSTDFNENTAQRMPYVGDILEYQPDVMIKIGYTLDLDEDLYLKDHTLIHASEVRNISSCLPVLPMTFGLEMMGEAAACLAPGLGLIGFKNVTASNWVGLEDITTLPITLSARFQEDNSMQMSRKIKVELFKKGYDFPAMRCDVIFGKKYLLSVSLIFSELVTPQPLPISVEQLYSERFLFHGPLLQCISKIHAVGKNGLIAEVKLFKTDNLFRSTDTPELLTHPSFMDGLAQLMVAWFIDKEFNALPIGIDNIELYCPIPKLDQDLAVYLQISEQKYKTISVNLEIHDGKENVWMRIENWKYVIFRHCESMSNFLRLPEVFFASTKLPDSSENTITFEISKSILRDINIEWLARTILHKEELSIFKNIKENSPEIQDWLLQRLVAKDAARHWIITKTSHSMIHPASFALSTKKEKTFSITHIPDQTTTPTVVTKILKNSIIAIAQRE
ncbi:Polyketide synthase dehydratase [Desulfocicer vacuolatum DSM 3385]|uniref:Polyketide synthase dehydratase n=1 Tax=Desulfocicer vacuolatum DSM 3385 TaxID=1121400 RepID=A0A1W2CY69_9BACT|nr:polyketide synthase dehydratase domain-containing protein [Desulfocicer vacuolatum]SMC90205.1 Polyketide synthase dehydratase [Desulfocicer vacuolatum DSM 3385]